MGSCGRLSAGSHRNAGPNAERLAVAVEIRIAAELSGDDHWPAGKLLVYNAVFFATAITAIGYFVAALATPKQAASPTPVA